MDAAVGDGIVIERVAVSDKDAFIDVASLLAELHHTVGVFPLDPGKMTLNAAHVVQQGMTFVARDTRSNARPIIGSIGLVETDAWYSQETYLADKWFFVDPAHRGRAGLKLLFAARDEGIRRDRIVYVWNTNPDKRQKALPFGIEAQRLGFVPFGYMVRLNGRRASAGQTMGA